MVDLSNKSEKEKQERGSPESIIPWMALGWLFLIIGIILVLAFCVPKVDAQVPEPALGILDEGYCWAYFGPWENSNYCQEYQPWGTYTLIACIEDLPNTAFDVVFEDSCDYTRYTYFPLVTVQRTILGEPIRRP